jgi:NitT/TauT family transport system substrate-binding protein
VQFVSAPSPGEAPNGLFHGTVDVTWGGPMRVNQIYDQRAHCDLVCFGEAVTRDPFMLIGRIPRPNFRLAVLTAVRLATVSEVPTPWLCLQEDLRRANIDSDAIPRVTGQSMAENADALRRGEVDVVQLFQPFAEELLEAGAAHIWQAAAQRGPTSYTTLYARRAVLAQRGDECQRMVRALHRTLGWVHASTGAQLAAAIASYFPDVPQPRLASALDRYKALGLWGQDTRLPRLGYERLKAGLMSGGLIKTGVPFETAVDNSLAELAVRENPPSLPH